MFYGRALRLFDPETSSDVSKMLLPSKINNIVNHFQDRWKKEYLVNLRKYQKIKHSYKHQQIVNVKGIVIIVSTRGQYATICMERWNHGRSYQGTDENILGAVVRVPRRKSLIKRPVNRFYLIERV